MAASSEEIPGIGLPLLPTTVIGSYAYPSWLWTALEEMRQGKYGETDIAETLGDAVRMAILDQEEAGIDIINDGEMRRWYVFQSWYKRLSGLEALEPLRKVGFYAHDSSLRYRPIGRLGAPRGLGISGASVRPGVCQSGAERVGAVSGVCLSRRGWGRSRRCKISSCRNPRGDRREGTSGNGES